MLIACCSCKKNPKALLKSGLSDYCSRKCGQESLKLGAYARACQSVQALLKSSNKAPSILPINNNYETFKDGGFGDLVTQSVIGSYAMAVSKQFIDQWKHQTRIPNVLKVSTVRT